MEHPKWPGCTAALVDLKDIPADLWPLSGGLDKNNMEGSRGWLTLGRSNRRRMDPDSIPLDGTPQVIKALSEPVYVSVALKGSTAFLCSHIFK
jgi:hypothetical protein